MTARKLTCRSLACLLVAISASHATAEEQTPATYLPAAVYESDAQFFAPVDLDFDGLPIGKPCGYSFSYDRVYWNFEGERVGIGSTDTDDGSLAPFRNFLRGRELGGDLTDGAVIPPTVFVPIPVPTVLRGIDSGPPRSDFAAGDRYEIGYSNEEGGWSIGFLDGPEANSNQVYGLQTQDELYGSVYVVFDDPQNLMFGFIDVIDPLGGAFQPDGLADDIDGDDQYGPDGYSIDPPGRQPDTFIGDDIRGDFDDLVRLPTSFQFLTVRNVTETKGLELMKTHKLNNEYMMKKHQNNQVEIGYGVRYLQLSDAFDVSGTGGVMGESFWRTSIDNNIVGPQIQLGLVHQRDRLRLDLNSRFLFGFNVQNFNQDVGLGTDLIPGQHNRPIYFTATVADHGKAENDFSPTGEIRAQLSYQLTSALALKLGYTAVYIDSISRAAQNVKYELPKMGFNNSDGDQEILINGGNVGFEAVY